MKVLTFDTQICPCGCGVKMGTTQDTTTRKKKMSLFVCGLRSQPISRPTLTEESQ